MLYLIVIPIAILIGLAFIAASTPTTEWEQAIELRFLRDHELRKARDEFFLEHGREPTTNELWSITPPTFQEE